MPNSLKATASLQLNTILPDTKSPTLDLSIPTLIYNSYNLDPAWRAKENVNRVLLLEPTHFAANPVSANILNFILEQNLFPRYSVVDKTTSSSVGFT